MKCYIVSLGCSKALVDSELIMGKLSLHGHSIIDNPKEAEVILLNTCGFLKEASQESVDTILELAQYKEEGNCKWLIMCGCLPQRYGATLAKQLPEVDAFIGTGELVNIGEVMSNLEKNCNKERQIISVGQPQIRYTSDLSRSPIIGEDKHYRYLKISEGCDHTCTFCTIPGIRGKYQSRSMEDIVKEAEILAGGGAKELILIAQDSTYYGIDIYGKKMLHELLKRVAQLDGLEWVRLFYAYPNQVTKELLQVIAEEPKICKYMDIPLQHCDERILSLMQRGGNRKSLKQLVARIRENVPGIFLRTTFIVGFPGETEKEFNELSEFVNEMRFERMGVFVYSREEGTPSFGMPGQVHWQTKKRRKDILMNIQSEISSELNAKIIGRTLKVIVDGISQNISPLIQKCPPSSRPNFCRIEKVYMGRTEGDAPEIDQNVYIVTNWKDNDSHIKEIQPGVIMPINIIESQTYDLIGIPSCSSNNDKHFFKDAPASFNLL